MKLITRNHYLNKLIDVKNTPDIKVITGVRRSGKSKLMDAFIDILEKEENANVIRIKLNLKEFEKLKDKEELYKNV
jgi:predicted AAA+ superfamily ATPase